MNQDNESSSDIPASVPIRLINALRANQNADDLFDECVVEFLGVNRSAGRCLDIVDRLGRTTPGRLAAESGLTTGAVTALVDRMEQAGYLQRTRDTEDRRRVWIEVTDLTRRMNQRLFGHLAIMLPPLFERFTDEQMEGIVQFLEVGTWINRQRAALLQDHLVASNASTEERSQQADAFAKAAEDMAHVLGDQLRAGKMPEDFCDPGKEI